MAEILIFFVGFLIGLIAWWLFRRPGSGGADANLIAQQAAEKQRNLEQITELASSHEKLTNDQVQQALGISDSTATRYLQELVASGQLRAVGQTGRAVYYLRTQNEE